MKTATVPHKINPMSFAIIRLST